jgi:hypothetical protein
MERDKLSEGSKKQRRPSVHLAHHHPSVATKEGPQCTRCSDSDVECRVNIGGDWKRVVGIHDDDDYIMRYQLDKSRQAIANALGTFF